jgi:predicted transcriptional regulator
MEAGRPSDQDRQRANRSVLIPFTRRPRATPRQWEVALGAFPRWGERRYNTGVRKRKSGSPSSPEPVGRIPTSGFRPRLQRYLRRFVGRRLTVLESFLGRLELCVMEVLWSDAAKRSVRDLQEHFPNLAYTTLMTTLDRLHKKGILGRHKRGRAYLYYPRFTRAELESHLAKDALDSLLGPMDADASIRPVLSSFVDAVGGRDALLLDELEELIREKKRSVNAEPEKG